MESWFLISKSYEENPYFYQRAGFVLCGSGPGRKNSDEQDWFARFAQSF
jgi:hypothetical protein